MLVAEAGAVADGLVLLSYPLHPPKSPDKKRTEHFPQLHVPALFIHGTNDPFGTPAEMEAALELIPAKTKLVLVEGGVHGLVASKASAAAFENVTSMVLSEFQSFFGN